jgi:hypothetical protein
MGLAASPARKHLALNLSVFATFEEFDAAGVHFHL